MTWTVETAPIEKLNGDMCAAELLNHLEISGWNVKQLQIVQKDEGHWLVIVAWQQ